MVAKPLIDSGYGYMDRSHFTDPRLQEDVGIWLFYIAIQKLNTFF